MCADNLPIQSRPAAVRRRGRILYASVATAAATIAAAGAAKAQSNDYWNQPNGGAWETASNWSLNALPGNAVFNLSTAAPYTVTMTSAHHTGGDMAVVNNNLTLSPLTTTILASDQLDVTAMPGESSSLTMDVQDGGSRASIQVVNNSGGLGSGVCSVGGGGHASLTLDYVTLGIPRRTLLPQDLILRPALLLLRITQRWPGLTASWVVKLLFAIHFY